jgi:outer membrane protein assembly factor BamB
MNDGASPDSPTPRLWPGIVIVALLWPLIVLPGWLAPTSIYQFLGMFWGPILGAVAVAAWWLFASRIPWPDRVMGVAGCVLLGLAAWFFSDPTVSLFGLVIYALPRVLTVWVVWLVLTPFLAWPTRRAGLLVVLMLTWVYFSLIRLDGVDGNFSATLAYRWSRTAEEKFLADLAGGKLKSKPSDDATTGATLTLQPGDWPGFRGPNRDGHLTGVRIATDWKQHPPREVWRHRIGPGWSSFAVVGTHLYTQEQRGDDEVVVCYDTGTGGERWVHRDSTRFKELVSGAGPRATPTFHEGKLYTLGANGRLNCLDAATGHAVWSRDIVADSGAKVPTWGFASSPLVIQGVVAVFAGGPEGKSVLGYNASSGEPAWSAGEGEHTYCSLHPARLGGVEQLIIATEQGLTAFEPTHGKVLWTYSKPMQQGGARVVQPTLVDAANVLIGGGFGIGTQRVHVVPQGDGWEAKEEWTTDRISPYFNDLVLHQEHLYGFHNSLFTCIRLNDKKEKWRVRGYDNGQVLLLADQDLLLVLSEKGDVALVKASPNRHQELARFKAIEGKTWNHPVIAHGKLFVRNSEEAACFQLELEYADGTAAQ